MRYALIDLSSSRVVNVVEIEEGDGSSDPEGMIHVASETASIGDGWDGASFVPPPVPPPTTEELWAAARTRRAPLLQATDIIAIRCFKAGVEWPEDWKAYTQKLRDITKQPDPASLDWPTAPPIPDGA